MSYQHERYEIDGTSPVGLTWAVGKWYVHAQSDEYLSLWPPEAEQQKAAHYLAYEIALDVRINCATGKGEITGVSGTPLTEPVKL